MGVLQRKQIPPAWPPEDGYQECSEGWHASASSEDWLYKPALGIFFHTPTETLWRRYSRKAGEQCRFARVDSDSLDGLSRLTIRTFGACGAAARVLQRACFLSWRAELHKFEEMERDLAGDGCLEARMEPLRGSSPTVFGMGAGKLSGGDKGNSSFFELFSQFPLLESMLALPWAGTIASFPGKVEPEAPPRGGDATKNAVLTTALLVRHNMKPGIEKAASSQPPRLSREKGVRYEDLPLVHREREAGWRHHIHIDRDTNVVDESLGISVGDLVRFDGERHGVVNRACPKKDEYEVHVDGKLLNTSDGQVRCFKAYELAPPLPQEGTRLAEQELLTFGFPRSASAR